MAINNQQAKFYKADPERLRAAIDETSQTDSRIAADANCNRNTLKRALDGDRILRAKYVGITNSLKKHGWNGTPESIFKPEY
ncbi:MAG: hypothetical protein ABW094_12315 [Candidatus Thiodiazotropha sp.]